MKGYPKLFEIPATNLLSDDTPSIVNVATVPKLSPFRYPGGKTWLIPEIRAWVLSLPQKPELFIEPFSGGGIASLSVVFEQLAPQVVMAELDEYVGAVWKVILTDADWLIERILGFEINLDRVQQVLSQHPTTLREKAFQTILRNRVQRGGIMAPGASLMKAGESGRGIGSRWYPKTLASRIRAIYHYKDSITFIQGDGFNLIERYLDKKNVAFFIDPPYTAGGKKAGKRLYLHNGVDHEALFDLMARTHGDFMMTYDDTEEVEKMALERGFGIRKVLMKNTHHNKLYELLIEPKRYSIS